MVNYTSVVMNLLDLKISEKIFKISSNCVIDDYYLLSNLISSNEKSRQRGFMAFSVTKPPITISLECKLKIDLESIKVHAVLNSLKSTKFQIMTEFTEKNEELKTKTICYTTVEDEFSGFCLSHDCCDDTSLKSVKLEDHLDKYVKNINKLIIIIKDTNFKRAPVLKKIEIFGNLSSSNDPKEVEDVLNLLNAQTIEPKVTETSTDVRDTKDEEKGFQIPEDFLDAITQDILNLPYILPSGSVVDESTLEKHKRIEAAHGRFPSDPFTGLLFTADSQPKFDGALKARLDEFKLKNSEKIEIMNSGRSVGRRQQQCEPSTSKQFNSHISKKIKLNNQSSSLEEIIQSIYRNKQISSFINPQNQQSDKKIHCLKCNSSDDKNLYKISTCSHVYCKKCILNLNLTCSTCSKPFENRHVVKINL